MKRCVFVALAAILFFQLLGCGKIKSLIGADDNSNNGKNFERVLLSEEKEPGYHLIFWDGKDSQGSFVPVGEYFFRMEAGDFSKSISVEALKGSNGSVNEPPSVSGDEFPSIFNLSVKPNPFYTQDGTWAIIKLPISSQVKLTITSS